MRGKRSPRISTTRQSRAPDASTKNQTFRVREDADGLVEAGVRPFELVLQFQTLEAAHIGIGHVRKRDMK